MLHIPFISYTLVAWLSSVNSECNPYFGTLAAIRNSSRFSAKVEFDWTEAAAAAHVTYHNKKYFFGKRGRSFIFYVFFNCTVE
jgi:hypothetical protein